VFGPVRDNGLDESASEFGCAQCASSILAPKPWHEPAESGTCACFARKINSDTILAQQNKGILCIPKSAFNGVRFSG
jgi:hypothetical protein